MMKNQEQVQNNVHAQASVGVGVAAVEEATAIGTYHVECWGPVDAQREDYITLRDTLALADPHSDVYQWLKRELDAIPLERKWEDTVCNLVTTVGKNNMLDNHLAGSAYTAAWFLGLISTTGYTTGPVVGDTMASHGGWAEDQNYAAATRPAPSFSAASGGSKATSANVSFSMNATTTIKGCFLNSVSTKGGTTGTLYSAGLFTGGDQPVVNGNTLNVSYTSTLT